MLQENETIGAEGFLQEMDAFITREDMRKDNTIKEKTPILITGDPCSGKSTLIAKWIKSHKISHKTDNDYFIFRFSKLSPSDTSYVSLIYSIYSQIRVRSI